MEFKIDTRKSYVHIAPTGMELNANMAAGLQTQASQLAEAGSQNFLIDLSACQTADPSVFESFALWHENCYGAGQSLVFTGLNAEVLKIAKSTQMDGAINIAPTEMEAIDLINMEILQRDLFGEES